ncbi:MAG TPA: hypothetical protein PLW81_13870 [Thiobacillaceae bacterium]|nr:hypothetical protein [Thiobacillaceae bacterium]
MAFPEMLNVRIVSSAGIAHDGEIDAADRARRWMPPETDDSGD